MKRRAFLFALTAVVAAPGAAFAIAIEDQIVNQLRMQGYDDIKVFRTLLGRLRFVATSDRYRREIVLNPRTGEILRDFWRTLDGADVDNGPRILDQTGSDQSDGGAGHRPAGSGGEDDDDDDDHDDKDDRNKVRDNGHGDHADDRDHDDDD